MLKKLVWFLGFLGLLALVALIYLTTIPKDDAPNIIQKILPSSFFATEYNSFSKSFHSSSLYSITAIDKKTLIAVGYGGVILKSTDGGESFKEINSPTSFLLYSITSIDKKTLVAVGLNGDILKSSDGGESFKEINSPTSSFLRSITAIDKKTLVAVGGKGVILKSTDGGESFKKIESGIYNALDKAIYFNDRVYIVGDNLGVVYLDTKEWKLHFLDYFTKKSSWFYPLLGAFLFYLLSWLFLLY